MDFAQARDVFRAGRLPECLAALQDVVRNDPASPAPRLFLFQVQLLLGQWDRALTQLKVLTDLDPARAHVYALYAGAVRGEIVRREVFAGRGEPAVTGGAPPWMAAGLAAARAVAGAGDADPLPADVADLVARAAADAPRVRGTVNGFAAEGWADADGRFGPVLEAFVAGEYRWVPLSGVRALHARPPAQLHDLIWAPVRITARDGTLIEALVPVRYPGAENEDDPDVRLGRRTDFVEPAPGARLGAGQRLLVAGEHEVALLDVRTASFDASAGGPA